MLNTRVYKLAIASALLLSAMAVRPATAQIVSLAKVNLPFDVTVAGTPIPAGQYTILSAREDSGSPILMFRSEKGSAVEVLAKPIQTLDNSESLHTQFIVGEHGSERTLNKLWIAGQSMGYDFTR
jgi:hypothetical protein